MQNALITLRHSHGKMSRNEIHFYFGDKRHEKLMLYESVSYLRNRISNHSIDFDGLLFNTKDIFLAFIALILLLCITANLSSGV